MQRYTWERVDGEVLIFDRKYGHSPEDSIGSAKTAFLAERIVRALNALETADVA